MPEQIYIYDTSGDLVNDPARSFEYATGLNWSTQWPKGYDRLSCVVPRSIVERWAVKLSYEIIIRDGQRIVYQGRLNSLSRALQAEGEHIPVSALGWYCRLVERHMHKRWVDHQAVRHLEWPSGATRADQELFAEERPNEDSILIRMGVDDRNLTADTQTYYTEYAMPHGSYVRRITFDYKIRTGEGLYLRTRNVDQSATEDTITMDGDPNEVSGSEDITFSEGDTRKFQFRVSPYATDTYDQNDWVRISNLVVYSETSLGQDDIIQDVIDEVNEYSTGSSIADPGFTLNPFVTDNDSWESCDSIIQRVAVYGDSSLNSYGACVWDEYNMSDGKPQFVFEQKPTATDYEYECHLVDLLDFSDDTSDDELYNYVVVRYEDEKGVQRHHTPEDNASQEDSDSQTRYGRRDYLIDIGVADDTLAEYVGDRFLNYHKDPLHKAQFSIAGEIRRKTGGPVPVNRVRAGERVKILDYDGGTVFVLRSTDYDAENKILRMSPDLPEDNLALLFAQREAGLRP